MNLEVHPISTLFPEQTKDEFFSLCESIKEHGQDSPIVVHEGRIIDGRHRFKACTVLDIEPKVIEYTGTDPIGFAFRSNLERRHLSASQRAMVCAEYLDFVTVGESANPPTGKVTREQAAKIAEVSPRTVDRAKQVKESGDEDLIGSVRDGRLTVRGAEAALKMPEEQRKEILQSDNPQKAIGLSRASNIQVKEIEGCPEKKEQLRITLSEAYSVLKREGNPVAARINCVLQSKALWL